MTQAARSVPANIAEGNSRHSTSRETEMKLTDVARASLVRKGNISRKKIIKLKMKRDKQTSGFVVFRRPECNLDSEFHNRIQKAIDSVLIDVESHLSAQLAEELEKRREQIAEWIDVAISNAMSALEEDKFITRGRRKIIQLLGGVENHTVCSWFDKVKSRLTRFISTMGELLVCFFTALFDLRKTESRYGKAKCYYDIMKAHLKEKIPIKLRQFQNALRWFTNWRKKSPSWSNHRAEEEKHRIWENLCQLIKGELLRLEPKLVLC